MKHSFLRSAFLALVIAALLTAFMLWFFQIPVAEWAMWKKFPEGWTIKDLVRNAFAVLFFGGAVVTVYKVLRDYG